MDYYMGLDLGSTWSKGVIIDSNKKLLAKAVEKTGYSFQETSEKLVKNLVGKLKIDLNKIKKIVSTGYGRKSIDFSNFQKTEILCHSKGAYYFFKDRITLIDIGGQDNKVVHIGEKGEVINFKMNRKCAAGTGAFIEESLNRLQILPEKVGELVEKADKDITIASFCTVFAQTEIIKLIKENEKVENIVKGIFNSVAVRVIEMESLSGNVVLTGGVIAYYPFFKEILEKRSGCKVMVPPDPQFTGAFGAALFGIES